MQAWCHASCTLEEEQTAGLLLKLHWREGSATVSAPRYPTFWKQEETQMTPGLTYTAVQIILWADIFECLHEIICDQIENKVIFWYIRAIQILIDDLYMTEK